MISRKGFSNQLISMSYVETNTNKFKGLVTPSRLKSRNTQSVSTNWKQYIILRFKQMLALEIYFNKKLLCKI